MLIAKSQLNSAISAHVAWKKHLNEMISSGVSDTTPAAVATDNQCRFGKWLYTEIDPSLKTNPHYDSIITIHAELHRRAAKVLQIALSGNKEDAIKDMALNSDFMNVSTKLTHEIAAWRDSLTD